MSKTRAIAIYLADVRLPIGHARLEAYRAGGNDLDMLARYYWNIALGESLYPALSSLEVTLRNSIHQSGARFFTNDRWFDDPRALPLQTREQTQLTDAKQELLRRGRPLEVGRIIAELPFAFWTGLLNAPYERRLWAPQTALGLLPGVFPFVPNRYRSRQPLFDRVNKVRFLRNRIAHHEPIWNWTRPSLDVQHREIIETIGWMNPAVQRTIARRPLRCRRRAWPRRGAGTRAGDGEEHRNGAASSPLRTMRETRLEWSDAATNPTLIIAAQALRVADHLKSR